MLTQPIQSPGYENGRSGRETGRNLLSQAERAEKAELQFGDNVITDYGSGIVVNSLSELIGIRIVYWNELVPESERRDVVYLKQNEVKRI